MCTEQDVKLRKIGVIGIELGSVRRVSPREPTRNPALELEKD